jgi:hypothetical protein
MTIRRSPVERCVIKDVNISPDFDGVLNNIQMTGFSGPEKDIVTPTLTLISRLDKISDSVKMSRYYCFHEGFIIPDRKMYSRFEKIPNDLDLTVLSGTTHSLFSQNEKIASRLDQILDNVQISVTDGFQKCGKRMREDGGTKFQSPSNLKESAGLTSSLKKFIRLC